MQHPLQKTIDLNADLGEGGAHDETLMALTSSVNIACGGHAGDVQSVRRSVKLAVSAGVAIGAHPSYEDPENFGRKIVLHSPSEIRDLILRQLDRILQIHPQLHHVKPHGALYHQSNEHEATAEALVAAIAAIQPDTILYSPPHGALAKAATDICLRTCAEGFIDRRYQDNSSLCPRTNHRSVIGNIDEAISQALSIALQRTVTTLSGAIIPLEAHTLCVHGDSPNAIKILRRTRASLEAAGITIMAP